MKILSFYLVELALIYVIMQPIEHFEEHPSCFHTYFYRDMVWIKELSELFLYLATYIVIAGRISSHSFKIGNVCEISQVSATLLCKF